MTASFTDNPQSSTLSVLDIVEGTSVDGVGLRTSIYLAGCENGLCRLSQSAVVEHQKRHSLLGRRPFRHRVPGRHECNLLRRRPSLAGFGPDPSGTAHQGGGPKDHLVLHGILLRGAAEPWAGSGIAGRMSMFWSTALSY